jgi:glycosyltransferase involved in cell wall biosynthesis
MIHKGMDINWFKYVVPIPRRELGIPDHATLVGCVANVRRIKGVPYLIKATYQMNPALPVHILLIGSGMDSASNLRLIESSPFKDRIHILGFRKDVYEVVSACNIYIQPSLSESLSRSVMEAMCLGVPCIVSNIGGLMELVDNEKSGLIVEKGNARAIARAIERLAGDPVLRKTLSGEAITRMKQIFSVGNMVMNTLKLYERTAN